MKMFLAVLSLIAIAPTFVSAAVVKGACFSLAIEMQLDEDACALAAVQAVTDVELAKLPDGGVNMPGCLGISYVRKSTHVPGAYSVSANTGGWSTLTEERNGLCVVTYLEKIPPPKVF